MGWNGYGGRGGKGANKSKGNGQTQWDQSYGKGYGKSPTYLGKGTGIYAQKDGYWCCLWEDCQNAMLQIPNRAHMLRCGYCKILKGGGA